MLRLKIALSLLVVASLPAAATTDIYGRVITEDSRLLPLDALPAGSLPTQAESVNGAFSLLPYVAHATGGWASSVAIGDVTGDGLNDVGLTTGSDGAAGQFQRLFVFPQSITGDLLSPVTYPLPLSMDPALAMADVDGQGRIDAFVGGESAIIRVKHSAGTLQFVEYFPIGAVSSVLLPRMAFTSPETRGIYAGHYSKEGQYASNAGDDGFVFRTLFEPVGLTAKRGFATGDLTGDGGDDVIFASRPSYPGPAIIFGSLTNNPYGLLGNAKPLLRVSCGSLEISDLDIGNANADDGADIVSVVGGNGAQSCMQVFRSTAHPQGFASPVTYSTYDNPNAVVVADMNLDGRDDVVVLHGGWNAVGVYLQQTDGSLGDEVLYPIPYASFYANGGLAVGDFTGDACPDVAIADYNNGLVTLEGSGCLAPIIFQGGFE